MRLSAEIKSPERSKPKPGPNPALGGVPTLNKYAKARAQKGESTNYLELVKALQDASKQGSTGSKSILPKVLPGLCKFSDLPPTVVPLLIAITKLPDKKDETVRKLQRVCYYLLQVAFGAGTGGTSKPYGNQAGGSGQEAPVPLELASAAWSDAKTPEATLTKQRLALRLLAAVARGDAADPTALSSSSSSSAPAEGAPSMAVAELVQVLGHLIEGTSSARALVKKKSSIFGGASGSGKDRGGGRSQAAATMRSVLPAIRVGLGRHPGAARAFLGAGYEGLGCGDPVGVRHAAAVAAAAAASDPAGAVQSLAGPLMATLKAHGSSGLLFGASAQLPTSSSGKGLRGSGGAAAAAGGGGGGAIVLEDRWARVHLSRLCASVVHSDNFAAAASREQAAPFWVALLLLATRDPDDMVAMAAIREVAGCPAPRPADLSAAAHKQQQQQQPAGAGSHNEQQHQVLSREGSTTSASFSPTASAANMAIRASENRGALEDFGRIRSWMMILKETQRSTLPSSIPKAAAPAPQEAAEGSGSGSGGPPQTQPSETLIALVVVRLRTALRSNAAPLVCAAARAAAALCQARALAVEEHGAQAQGGAVVVRAMELLQKELRAATSGRGDAQQRCLAVEALLWMQIDAHQQPPLVGPGAVFRHVSLGGPAAAPGGGAPAPWSPHLVRRLLDSLMARLLASHAMAPLLLKCSVAAAAAAPSNADPDQLTLLWAAALRCGPSGRTAALHAAFEVLDSAPPPAARLGAAAAHGPAAVAAAAREGAAWAALQRVAAWWLGANANAAAGELVWAARRPQVEGVSDPDAPPLEVLTRSGQRNLLLGGAISQLQRVLLAGAWQVRVVAAQALGKVAVRSPEPYRMQCYAILKCAVPEHGSGGDNDDPLGVATTVNPILRILDACYSSAIVLERCVAQWGPAPEDWPPQHLESFRSRHQQLLADISSKVCYVPPRLFLPLGWASLPLVRDLPETVGPDGFASRRLSRASAPSSVTSGLEGSGLEELMTDGHDLSMVGLDATLSHAAAGEDDEDEDGEHRVPALDEAMLPVRAVVVSDFVPAGEAGGEEELEVEEGEEVTVEALETGGAGALVARIRTLSGETGHVPMEHLEVAAAEEVPGAAAAAAGDASALRSGLSSGALSEQDQEGDGAGAAGVTAGVAAGVAAVAAASHFDAFEFDSPSKADQELAMAAAETGPSHGGASGLFGNGVNGVSSAPSKASPLRSVSCADEAAFGDPDGNGDLSFNDESLNAAAPFAPPLASASSAPQPSSTAAAAADEDDDPFGGASVPAADGAAGSVAAGAPDDGPLPGSSFEAFEDGSGAAWGSGAPSLAPRGEGNGNGNGASEVPAALSAASSSCQLKEDGSRAFPAAFGDEPAPFPVSSGGEPVPCSTTSSANDQPQPFPTAFGDDPPPFPTTFGDEPTPFAAAVSSSSTKVEPAPFPTAVGDGPAPFATSFGYEPTPFTTAVSSSSTKDEPAPFPTAFGDEASPFATAVSSSSAKDEGQPFQATFGDEPAPFPTTFGDEPAPFTTAVSSSSTKDEGQPFQATFGEEPAPFPAAFGDESAPFKATFRDEPAPFTTAVSSSSVNADSAPFQATFGEDSSHFPTTFGDGPAPFTTTVSSFSAKDEGQPFQATFGDEPAPFPTTFGDDPSPFPAAVSSSSVKDDPAPFQATFGEDSSPFPTTFGDESSPFPTAFGDEPSPFPTAGPSSSLNNSLQPFPATSGEEQAGFTAAFEDESVPFPTTFGSDLAPSSSAAASGATQPPSREQAATSEHAEALYDFVAQEAVEVSVSAGEKLTLVHGVPPTADGWTLVRASDGREGVVPTSYLRTGPGEAGRVYPCPASVKFAFEGEAEGELTVAAGDALTVIREIDGWFHARKDADGTEGLVPTSYLAI